MTKIINKGYIIDNRCDIKGELVENDGKVYSVTLNQTDLGENKNKFYIMQLIKNASSYVLFCVYGRISEPGKTIQTTHSTESSAISAFEKQFKAKTGNSWWTDKFVKKEGKYFMSEISYENELKDIKEISLKIPDSKLHERTQKLITMLSDINMIKNSLISLDFDVKKLPLGKLKQSQIEAGTKVLNLIQNKMKELSGKKDQEDQLYSNLLKLSSDYYTYIPYSCGRKKPPIINTDEIINKYIDVLNELTNIVVTVQITENIKADENPVDAVYRDINTKITPLDKNSQMWNELIKYIANTHGPTHGCKLEVLDIYEIEQNDKRKKFDDYCSGIDNHTLLFHGSGMSNWISIMKNDFYLDPAKLKDINVPIAGAMFGYGCYTADSSKSWGYTRAHSTNDIGCFAVCEVALGKQLCKMDSEYNLNKNKLSKNGYHSTKGEGRWQPSEFTMIDNIKIPNGKLKEVHKTASLRYNEFIVYDVNQIQIRYLMVIKNKGDYKGF